VSARYKMDRFEIVDRGFGKYLVLVPGWATDCCIFSGLELEYNYIVADAGLLDDFSEALADFLEEKKIAQASLLGWSLGGFLAADFALNNQARTDKVFLFDIALRVDTELMGTIARKVEDNCRAFLRRFYADCFSPSDKEGREFFKAELMPDYLKQDKHDLLDGLGYLAQARLSVEELQAIKNIRVFHGEHDKIFALKDILPVKEKLSADQFVVLDALGHLPFLNPRFNKDIRLWTV